MFQLDRAPDNLAEEEVVEWPLVVVALGFMFVYWLMCAYVSIRDGTCTMDTVCRCCADLMGKTNATNDVVTREGTKGDDVGEGDIQLQVSAPFSAGAGGGAGAADVDAGAAASTRAKRRRLSAARMSYFNASNAQHQQHRATGHNRHLCVDSPEFVGLSKETHSLHRLLIEQAEAMEQMMRVVASLGEAKKTREEELGRVGRLVSSSSEGEEEEDGEEEEEEEEEEDESTTPTIIKCRISHGELKSVEE